MIVIRIQCECSPHNNNKIRSSTIVNFTNLQIFATDYVKLCFFFHFNVKLIAWIFFFFCCQIIDSVCSRLNNFDFISLEVITHSIFTLVCITFPHSHEMFSDCCYWSMILKHRNIESFSFCAIQNFTLNVDASLILEAALYLKWH